MHCNTAESKTILQCCSALVLGHCTPVCTPNLHRCVLAVAQACWQPDLNSSTDQWGVHSAKSSIAVRCYWVTAQLFGQQIFIGVMAQVSKKGLWVLLQHPDDCGWLLSPVQIVEVVGGLITTLQDPCSDGVLGSFLLTMLPQAS